MLDKKGQESSYEEKTFRLEGAEYTDLAKPFKPAVVVAVARRLEGDSVIEDAARIEVEKSIEAQVKEAEVAIESKETEEKPISESEEAAAAEEAPNEI